MVNDSRIKESPEDRFDESDSILREEQALRDGEKGQSYLSPEREENDKGYISPFSDEFLRASLRKDEEIEDEGAIASGKVSMFLRLGFIIYLIMLVIGYHYTPFSDGVPQLIGEGYIEGQEYLNESNKYILIVEDSHTEMVAAIEKFTAGEMSRGELASTAKENSEKLNKEKQGLSEMKVPLEFEDFHSRLKELFTTQDSMNAAAVTYASSDTDDNFTTLDNINVKFEEASNKLMFEYNNAFSE